MIIKQTPEDFRVNEQIDLKPVKSGNYLIYKLIKKDWDSFKALETIADRLGTKVKFIGYAGNKDKKAITTQYVSFYKISKNRIDNLKIKDIDFEFVGYSHERINLGDLKGNNFIITARDLKEKNKIPNEIFLENYFDDQRLGNKFNTHLVGKAIIKKDFKKACEIIGITIINNDYIGELRKQHRRLLRFYISSYQSYLFNLILSKYIEDKSENKIFVDYSLGKLAVSNENRENFDIPLISFDALFDKKIKEIAEKILDNENIKLTDFIIKEMPELISETAYRKAFVEINNIKCKSEKDINNYKAIVEFFLPKGSYATLLMKKLELYLK